MYHLGLVNRLCIACITAELLWPHSAACIAVFSAYVANLYLLLPVMNFCGLRQPQKINKYSQIMIITMNR